MAVIVMTESVAERHREAILQLQKECATPFEVQHLPVRTIEPADLAGADAIFVSLDFAADGGNIRQLMAVVPEVPSIRWVHIGWAGSDSPMVQALLDSNVVVTHSAGATAEPIAQTVIGGMLALHRGFNRWFSQQRNHEWKLLPRNEVPLDLRGQTMVILGFGSIGQHVGRMAKAIGLSVIGVRRQPVPASDCVDEWCPPDGLLDILPRAHWLAVTVPLTTATRRMMDARAIAAMRPGAYVLNVSRGAIFEEPALIEALCSGALAGAYLDVFEKEPLPADSPFWDMPNVIVSPHDSWPSSGNNARTEQIFLEELDRWAKGRSPVRAVQER